MRHILFGCLGLFLATVAVGCGGGSIPTAPTTETVDNSPKVPPGIFKSVKDSGAGKGAIMPGSLPGH